MVRASPEQAAARIARYRKTELKGALLTLVPYSAAFVDDVCRLRNAPSARHALNLEDPLTPEKQRIWTAGYDARAGDLYWMLRTNDHRIIGTNALYNIDVNARTAEKGRLVVDEAAAHEASYALEADAMVLRLAFDELGIERVTALVRADDAERIAMNEGLGFKPCGARDVRGVLYGDYELSADAFDPSRGG